MPNPGIPYLFNYTFLDALMTKQATGEKNLDTSLLLQNFSFSSDSEIGLEFVDVLTNAIRRSLGARLQREGWINFHRLMIHRADEAYIKFILFGPGSDVVRKADCQSASNFDPASASNFDPFERRVRAVALAPSELVGVAETARARVVG